MEQNYDQFIGHYPGVLDQVWCSKIIDWFESKNDSHQFERKRYVNMVSVGSPQNHRSFAKLNLAVIRVLQRTFMRYRDKIGQGIQSPFHATLDPKWKIQRSDPGKGYTGYHCEQGNKDYSRGRFLTWMIYLNDTIGGETEFKWQNRWYAPTRGDVLIWPAAFTHMHHQKDNLKTKKYIATGWWVYDEELLKSFDQSVEEGVYKPPYV